MHKLILISGGTASGKTTLVNELKKLYKDKISVLSMDNYYKSNDLMTLEQRKNINFDHPDSIDFNMVKRDVKALLNGIDIKSPKYDFRIHSRLNDDELVKSSNIIVLEGIFALYDKELRELSSLNIFVDADSDIRFIRRLNRDVKERARTIDSVVVQYLKTVKPMHNLYVEKTKEYADIIINTTNNSIDNMNILIDKINELK